MQVSFTFDINDPVSKALWTKMWQLVSEPADSGVIAMIPDDIDAGTGEPVPTPRQAAAAKARAAKADKKPGPVEQVLGPANGANGADGAGEDDDLGMTDPSMSPAEAKEAGLALVREVYAAGHVKNVKDLQKEWKVAKFYDVPMEQGHAFYQRVVKMAVETGVRK